MVLVVYSYFNGWHHHSPNIAGVLGTTSRTAVTNHTRGWRPSHRTQLRRGTVRIAVYFEMHAPGRMRDVNAWYTNDANDDRRGSPNSVRSNSN